MIPLNGNVEKQTVAGREKIHMTRIKNLAWALRIWKDTRGQDLIEYALMAGFVAVTAGAILPNVATSITTIFNAINTLLADAADGAS